MLFRLQTHKDVISSDHLDSNSSLSTVRDGLSDSRSKRILDTSDSDEGEIPCEPGEGSFSVGVDVRGRPLLEILVADGDSST